ncbi:MAG: hypothetical protein DRO40_12170 [Thermoprotei archaeon]|nr:MAG: hypothetical protein DRO40_12170 [Thermoprotei archaeon]
METKVKLKALEEYIKEGLGSLEISNGNVEAKITIHLDPYGDTISFTIKGKIEGKYVIIYKYIIDNGKEVWERPPDELEAWIMFIEERYGRA